MNAPAPAALQSPLAIGTPHAGGILLGRFFDGEQPYALICAPKAEGERTEMMWNGSRAYVTGALSVYDGPANTRAMAEAGSEAAKWALELRIDGRDDWYLPARGEALLAYAANLQGAQAFARDWYWTSTQDADVPSWAWSQSFFDGYQGFYVETDSYRVFAVRREPIQ